jgi:hypothetical protein
MERRKSEYMGMSSQSPFCQILTELRSPMNYSRLLALKQLPSSLTRSIDQEAWKRFLHAEYSYFLSFSRTRLWKVESFLTPLLSSFERRAFGGIVVV